MAKKDKESRELAPWQAFSEISRWEREMERLVEKMLRAVRA